ncbi:MAG: hypothetical protein AUI60_03720 [Thaumarchaeota archaeon 13_1_40CM_2_39_4]|nr:MAG: hypothetical protein AUI60_03720 [Thaumarchaeota archaeon 13_1_40CM_2_39_4]
MSDFVLKGKIIDGYTKPAGGLQVKAFDHHLLSNELLGQTSTKPDGTFEIKFKESSLKKFEETIERGPHVYLVIEYDNGKRLKTRTGRIQKEIEYHIKLVEYPQDPSAVDIYGDSMRRTISMLNEVGATVNNERINIDSLANGKLPDEIRQRFQDTLKSYEEIIKNYTSLQALLDGVINSSLQENHLGTIGYDGPQVPRNTWRDGGDNVIIWPRKEEFKWE